MDLFPEPSQVFCGLMSRWDVLGGPHQIDDLNVRIGQGLCVVSDYEMHTQTFQTRPYLQKGAMGWVNYLCNTSCAEELAALNALARFGVYVGIGYQTARGMGAVRVTFRGEA